MSTKMVHSPAISDEVRRVELFRPKLYRGFAVALLVLHAVVVLRLIPKSSVTYNEGAHIAAGVACWQCGAYHLYCVNPPLPRMVSTVLLIDHPGISLDAMHRIHPRATERQEQEIANVFADTNSLDFHHLVCRARLAGVVWVTIGGIVVWWWTKELFGPLGAIIALSLWTFDPILTAHTAFVTADVPAAVMALVATYAFSRFLSSSTWYSAYSTGALLGLALLCKFTLLLLIPTWGMALIWSFYKKRHQDAVNTCSFGLASKIVVLCLTTWLVVCSGYEFKGVGKPLAEFSFVSKAFRNVVQPVQKSFLGNLPSPLPEDFIYGCDVQHLDMEGKLNSYLCGEWAEHGWWYYYLYAFAIKSPIGHLIVYGLTLLVVLVLRPALSPLLLLVPTAIVVTASAENGYTNHLRYILPAYPFATILTGVLASVSLGRARPGILFLTFIALLMSAICMANAYPSLLGYFNELVGGSAEGWRFLADSNVDWGQDWIALDEWLAAHTDKRPVYLAILSHVDEHLYVRQHYSFPQPQSPGYAIVDARNLTTEYSWLRDYSCVARIGTSLFVFRIPP